ncbi:MAG: hypothetical protein MJA83_05650 [Gammaproteobacteria bacterium]|nr:hypothetical protein [Gammaproteobacteria bacterium]
MSIGPLQIKSLDREGFEQPLLKMKFAIDAAVTSTPNKAKLQIWNLAENNRKRVQEKNLPVVLEAGYANLIRILFRGDVRFSSTVRQGPNWITTVNAGDGQSRYKSARINENLPSGTSIGDVLDIASKSLGVDLGNLAKKAQAGSVRAGLSEWVNGGVLVGKASDVISQIAKSMGLQWSVQGGSLLFLEEQETTDDSVVVISATTGMIGSPDVGEDGRVNVSSLLNGDLFPGRRIIIESRQVSGLHRVDKVKHVGDTWGGEWNSNMEARPIGG